MWELALSANILICWCLICLFTPVSHSLYKHLFIQDFFLCQYVRGRESVFTLLKQWGFPEFLITRGFNFSPVIFVHRATVILCFAFLLPAQSTLQLVCCLSSVLKNNPVSSLLRISQVSYPSQIVISLPFQFWTVCWLMSALSPDILHKRLCLLTNFSHHPFDSLKSVKFSCSVNIQTCTLISIPFRPVLEYLHH